MLISYYLCVNFAIKVWIVIAHSYIVHWNWQANYHSIEENSLFTRQNESVNTIHGTINLILNAYLPRTPISRPASSLLILSYISGPPEKSTAITFVLTLLLASEIDQ